MKTERQLRIEQLKQELIDLLLEEVKERALQKEDRSQNVESEVRRLWKSGLQIAAIKLYRSEFGCGLVESHRAVLRLCEEQR